MIDQNKKIIPAQMSLDKHQTKTLKFIANVLSVKFLSGLNLKANNKLFDTFELIWFASSTEKKRFKLI